MRKLRIPYQTDKEWHAFFIKPIRNGMRIPYQTDKEWHAFFIKWIRNGMHSLSDRQGMACISYRFDKDCKPFHIGLIRSGTCISYQTDKECFIKPIKNASHSLSDR